MARGIAARDFKSGSGDVRRDDMCAGEFVREGNGDAAGAGAYVRDAKLSVAAR